MRQRIIEIMKETGLDRKDLGELLGRSEHSIDRYLLADGAVKQMVLPAPLMKLLEFYAMTYKKGKDL